MALPSRWPEMRWNVTGVPAGNRLLSPPADVTVTAPSTGTPCSESFQPMSRASASIPASVWATDVYVPMQATPGRDAVEALRLRADDRQVDAAGPALEDLAVLVDEEVVAEVVPAVVVAVVLARCRARSPAESSGP